MVKVEELPEVENQIDRIRMLKENGLIPDDIDRIFHKIKSWKYSCTQYERRVVRGRGFAIFVVKLCGWFNEVYGSDYTFTSDNIVYKTPEHRDYKEKYEALLSSSGKQREGVANLKVQDISF